MHAALARLPADTVALHYESARKAVPQLPRGPDAIERYTVLFERLREVYAKASASKRGMLTFMV